MANEFVVQNGLLSLDNSTVSGSLTVTGGVTGSFTGSFTGISTTASFALTTDGATLTISGSTPRAKTGSLWYDSTTGKTYVYYVSASVGSWVLQSDPTFDPGPTLQSLQDVTDIGNITSNAITIANTTAATNTGSGALIISGGLGVKNNIYADNIEAVNKITATRFTASAGYLGTASNATSASFATTASVATSLTFTTFSNTSYYFPQNLTVEGTLTAQEFYTEFVSSSVIYESGSTKFGNSSDDIHQFTGSIRVLGSTTSSVFGTSSWASNSVSASFAPVGLGTSASIALFNSSNTISSSIIFQSGSNIGVNTNNPQARFHINDTASAVSTQLLITNDSTRTGIRFGSSSLVAGKQHDIYHRTDQPTAEWIIGAAVSETAQWRFQSQDNSAFSIKLLVPRNPGGTARILSDATHSFSIGANNVSDIIWVTGSGNVGMGTTSPLARLHVSASGTTNDLLIGDTTTPKLFVSGSGNVGIGDSAPSDRLVVNGRTRISGANVLAFGDSPGGQAWIGITSALVGTLTFRTYDGSSFVERMRIVNTTGNVGINTAAPSASLHVSASGTTNDFLVGDTTTPKLFVSASGNVVIGATGSAFSPARVSIQDTYTGVSLDNPQLVVGDPTATNGLSIGYRTDSNYAFLYARQVGVGTRPLVLQPGGNVGVGTSAPVAKMHISASGTGNDLLIGDTTTPKLFVSGSGDVAIGTTSTGARLRVLGSGANAAGVYIGATTDNYFDAQNNVFRLSNQSETMRINSSGNVGISTTSPAARLHISASGATNDLLVGTAATPKLLVTDTGSIGIGIVPSSWWSGLRAIQFGQRGNLQSSNNTVALGFNSVYDTSSNFRYVASDYALEYRLNSANGSHAWFIAPQGTAGNTISFTQAMTLDTSGSLGINTSAPYGRVHVRNGSSGVPSASVNANALVVESNQSNGVAVLLPAASTGYYTFGDPTDTRRGGIVYALSSQALGERMEFWVGGAGGARMTILPTGNVGIGTQSPTAPLHVQGNISASSYTSSISNAVGFLGTSSWAQSSSVAISSSFSITSSAANSITFTPATASYALSGSWLRNKAGSIANTAFTGTPRRAAVNFTGAFPNTNYAVVITGEDARTWTIEGKVVGGFTASANSNTALTGTTYWVATSYGET